jgi:DNA-binding transcriptional MerR regulator
MTDYLSIQKFSELTGVETSTLRYWDDIGIFSPVKRDSENNYRNYSLEQVIPLKLISILSELGIPLKTIAKLREERDIKGFLNLLDDQEREINVELARLRERLSIIHTRRELIRLGSEADINKIYIETVSNIRTAFLWPKNEYGDNGFLDPFTFYISQAEKYRINLGFPIGGRYDDMDSFVSDSERPQHFFSVDPTGNKVLRKGEYLVAFTRGYYGEFGDLPQRMLSYAEDNKIKIVGPVFVLYLHDETCMTESSQFLAQVKVEVIKPKRFKTKI